MIDGMKNSLTLHGLSVLNAIGEHQFMSTPCEIDAYKLMMSAGYTAMPASRLSQ